ncbi:hypothetical protein GO279_04223 [Ralstonia solanacearum]|nr:hypothetical protein GO278_004569 [Ralstonia solanacearum]NKA05897.1 hypothetical protein [Ralstonia solanacearum]NKA10301.1 hypothetical protein [Ralstonia solanacearum]NKA55529.1 hypothetical protein [Ralstonia solanacearum]NKA66403.1 hypothetical protein [Ralstonia solanacearum]
MEASVQALGVLLARIDCDKFFVSDGRLIELMGCTVEFT